MHQPTSDKAKAETKPRLMLVGWMPLLYVALIF